MSLSNKVIYYIPYWDKLMNKMLDNGFNKKDYKKHEKLESWYENEVKQNGR